MVDPLRLVNDHCALGGVSASYFTLQLVQMSISLVFACHAPSPCVRGLSGLMAFLSMQVKCVVAVVTSIGQERSTLMDHGGG